MKSPVFKLSEHPVHLGRGATATAEEHFSGDQRWFERYAARHRADGVEGRLVSFYQFDAPWDAWEMHPEGAELVLCTAGEITLIQEIAGERELFVLRAGEALINPPGVWHTADAAGPANALFVTAGAGTQHRPR